MRVLTQARFAFAIGAASPFILCCQPAISADNLAKVAPPRSSNATSEVPSGLEKIGLEHRRYHQKCVEQDTAAIKLNPNNVEAYMRRADAYSMLQQHQASIDDYSKVIALDPRHADAYRGRAAVYALPLKQYHRAIADYNLAISLDPYNADSLFSRGRAFEDLELYQEAIADLTKAIELNPKEGYAYSARCTAYKRLGKDDLAEKDWSTQGSLFLAEGDVQRCSTAISTDPSNIGFYYLRADAFSKIKQHRGALDDLTQVIRLKPDAAEAHFLRGKVWQELNNPQNAIQDYTEAIRLDSTGARARRWKSGFINLGSSERRPGLVYTARGDAFVQQCSQKYNTAFVGRLAELHRRSAGTPYLQETEKAEEEYRKAIQDYGTAISLDPKDAEGYEKRATAYKALNENYRAIRDYDSAIALTSSKDTDKISFPLAFLYGGRASCSESLKQFPKAIADHTMIINGLASLLGEYSTRASAEMSEIVDLGRSILANAYYNRGRDYRLLGQRGSAHADLNQAVALDPSVARRIALDDEVDRLR